VISAFGSANSPTSNKLSEVLNSISTRLAGKILVEVISVISTLALHRDAELLVGPLDAASKFYANACGEWHLHLLRARPQHVASQGELHDRSLDTYKP
jgi:hypothetical protein